jgi:hypothetical protein
VKGSRKQIVEMKWLRRTQVQKEREGESEKGVGWVVVVMGGDGRFWWWC